MQFINTNIAWDISESDSATGTIDTFDLTFGGGGASDLTAQDWSVDPKTGNVQYTTVGTYTVTLYVTDTGGNRSQAAKQRVDIVDVQGMSKVYISTSNTGIFTYLPGGSPATANTGLSGGDLNVNDGKLNPHYKALAIGQHHYWLANDNGLAYSADGCATYTKITKATLGNPTNTAGDASPPTTTDLDEIQICYDPQDIRRVYVLRLTDSTWNASFDPRAYLYWSNDYGVSFSSTGITSGLIGSTVKEINHDSSTTLSDFYSSVTDADGGATITPTAALNGTTNGLNFDYDSGINDAVLVETFTAHTGGEIYCQFRVNFANVAFSANSSLPFQIRIRNSSDQDVFRVGFSWTDISGDLDVNLDYYSDSGGNTAVGSATIDETSEVLIGVKLIRESIDTAADGVVELFVNDTSQATVTNADNIVRWSNIDRVRLFFDNSSAIITGDLYYDEWLLSVLGSSNYERGDGGIIMDTSQDGNFVFVALEDADTSKELVFKVTRPTDTSPTVAKVYEPSGGSNISIAQTGDPDRMVFHGNFASNVGVIDHAIIAGTNTDITPSSPAIGTDWLFTLRVDPSDINHMVVNNADDETVFETTDGGSTWTEINSATGLTANAMDVIFQGAYFPFGAFIGGPDLSDENLSYTPNAFANLREDTSVALKAVTAIVSIDIAPDTAS